ncbi:MAG: flagellar basal body L-ring protein FlgH, partial [Oceanococcus sp.]
FQDRLAAQPGDALTVILQERTQAQKSARTSTGKDQDFSLSVPLLGGVSDDLGIDTELSSSRGFDGSGDSSQSNSLQGELTVLVTERLPNGYLRVAGEKVLQLNQGSEYLRLSGIVRPDDIAPDNSVLSTRIAQADISYSGHGALAQANAQGWLARFFNSPLWPF